jgi:hypothetical protein
MPELRSRPVIRGSMADYRPAAQNEEHSAGRPPGHHKGDGQESRGAMLRTRRNGLPEPRLYRYGQSSYEWAVRALRAAEAKYGAPPADQEKRPNRTAKPEVTE